MSIKQLSIIVLVFALCFPGLALSQGGGGTDNPFWVYQLLSGNVGTDYLLPAVRPTTNGYTLIGSTDGSVVWGPGGGGGGMTIGAPVIGGFSGSVLFVDAGTNLAQDNTNFFWDTVNVRLGIGTLSPDRPLESLHTTDPQLRLTHTDNSIFTDFQVSSGHDLTVKPSFTGGVILQSTTDKANFFRVLDADGGAAVLSVNTIEETVGIGRDGGSAYVLDVERATTARIRLRSSSADVSWFLDGTQATIQNTSGPLDIKNTSAADIRFYTANTNRMEIQDSGTVGINTTNARRRLDVLDATNPQLRLTHTDNSKYADFLLDTNHDLTIQPSSTGQIILRPTTDQADFFHLRQAGGTVFLTGDSLNRRIGIRTAVPEYPLHITSDSDNVIKFTRAAFEARFEFTDVGQLRIYPDEQLVLGANGGAAFFINSTGSRSEMIANGNDLVYEWNRGNNGIQGIIFNGVNSEGETKYFEARGHSGATNQDDRVVFFSDAGFGGQNPPDTEVHVNGDIKQQIVSSNVSNPPTDAELDTLFTSPATKGDGWTTYIQDSDSNNFYQIVASGSFWMIFSATPAL